MVDAKSKYVLTYDLKILYCPNMQIRTACKELNLMTHEFSQFEGNLAALDNGFEIAASSVKNISDNILLGKVGNELPEREMKWIQDYEALLREDISYITNRELAFNYFILKLALAGFSLDMAKNIVVNYYTKIIHKMEVPHPQIFLNEINNVLKRKIYWVKYDLRHAEEAEYKFIKKVLRARDKIGYTFSFDELFRAEYLNVIDDGVARALIEYNQTPSYLVTKKLSLNEQMLLVLNVYKRIIWGLLVKAYQDTGRNIDEVIAKGIVKDMTNTLKLYLMIHSTDFD